MTGTGHALMTGEFFNKKDKNTFITIKDIDGEIMPQRTMITNNESAKYFMEDVKLNKGDKFIVVKLVELKEI